MEMADNYFLSRRSCRNFSNKSIEREKLESIIYQAVKAPTTGNMQLYSVIITRNQDKLKRLSSLHYNQPAAKSAPVILTICADFNRFTKWCEINHAEPGFDNFHSFLTALTDAVILAQQIVTIAEKEGLGSCYLGTVTYNAKEISEFLQLPDLVVPVASLAIGQAEEEGEPTDRLPINAIIHEEGYRIDSDEEIINVFKVHDNNPDNQKFIRVNNKENLAQVFAQVRYPAKQNKELSKAFLKLLREKGFIF